MRLPPVCAGGTTEDTLDVISSFLINTEYVNAGLVFGNDLQCNLAKESGPKQKRGSDPKSFFHAKVWILNQLGIINTYYVRA